MMKLNRTIFGIVFILVLIITNYAQQSGFPVLRGTYFGQNAPGVIPEIFAPGIVSTQNAMEYGITFSSDCKEVYFKRIDSTGGKNLMFKKVNDKWEGPAEAPLPEEGRYGELHVTPTGEFMLANKILQKENGQRYSQIVRLIRKQNTWIEDQLLFPGMRATSAENGNVYVTEILSYEKNTGQIVKYEYGEDGYKEKEVLGNGINIMGMNSSHPLIAPDESFLIFNSVRDKNDAGSLYISFKDNTGNWSEPKNLSRILEPDKQYNHWIASFSPEGKFLFFNIGRDIYWVDAKIIETLRQ